MGQVWLARAGSCIGMGAGTLASRTHRARHGERAWHAHFDRKLRGHGQEGFTIIELITVVVLLGILSMVAFSRFVRPSAFAPGIVAHGVVAETRLAQQRASSRHDAVVTLTVDRVGTDWRFVHSTDVDGVVRTELVGAANTTLQAQSGVANRAVDAANPLVVQFNADGDITSVAIGADAGDPAQGVSITLAGDSNRQVCVYSTGYAVEEPCA